MRKALTRHKAVIAGLSFAVLILLLIGAAVGVSYRISHEAPSLNEQQTAWVAQARRAGVTTLAARPLSDGGLLLNGYLDGQWFDLMIPWRWNRQLVLWADGYSAPGSWSDARASDNPLIRDRLGFLRVPYARGFAVADSAYAKSGMAVESGVENLYRLKRLADRLGSTRAYAFGASMGGNIVMALIEKHPHDFVGAIAACGVVGGWVRQIGWMIDIRAAYNYFTRGTRYALPGDKRITRSALATFPTGPLSYIAPATLILQTRRASAPILALFTAARAHPGGAADRIIDNVAAVAHTVKDPAAFALPLVSLMLGQDDLNATYGGALYDNTRKLYHSPYLSDAGNAALNREIQRVQADSAAVARANEWYQPTGRFDAKLISMYNTTDPLVPSEINESQLRAAVAQAGNDSNFLELPLPPLESPHFLGSGMAGLTHCGFTPEEVVPAVNEVFDWVETGRKPQ